MVVLGVRLEDQCPKSAVRNGARTYTRCCMCGVSIPVSPSPSVPGAKHVPHTGERGAMRKVDRPLVAVLVFVLVLSTAGLRVASGAGGSSGGFSAGFGNVARAVQGMVGITDR